MKLAGLVETHVAGAKFSLGQSASLFARVALGVLYSYVIVKPQQLAARV
jgi:hypothetical protein